MTKPIEMIPLTLAASDDLLHIVEALINKGAIVNELDDNGNLPLTAAAKHSKNQKLLKFLIDSGAEVNELDSSGHSPLMIAARYNTSKVVQLLIIVNEKLNYL